MKKKLICVVLSLYGFKISSQVNRYDQSAPSQPYVSSYVPIDFEKLKRIGDAMEAQYEKNKEYKNKLIDWIFDLKSKTTDKEFLNALNFQYTKLNSIELSSSSTESLDLVRQNIKEEIDKLNARIKEEPNRLWVSGNNNLKNENYTQAINDYTNLIQLNPDFPYVYRNRGKAYQYLGKFPLALNDFNKFIEMKNDDPLGYSSRGWAKYYLNDYMGALADFNKQIELEPNSPYAYYNRGSAKSNLNDEYGAISDYTKSN